MNTENDAAKLSILSPAELQALVETWNYTKNEDISVYITDCFNLSVPSAKPETQDNPQES